MATTIIDPDMGTGYDYETLALWEAGEQGTLTEPNIAQCRCTGGTADPGQVYIYGWTTSDTNYIKIFVESGYRHNGTIPTSGNIFRCRQTSDAVPFRYNETYVWTDGIAYDFAITNSRDMMETVSTTPTSGWLKFSNCICENTGGGGNRAFDLAQTGTYQEFFVWNCISIGMVQYGFAFGTASSTNTTYCFNCTAYGSANYGFRNYTTKMYWMNCLAQDNTLGSWSTSGTTYAMNNCRDSGSVPGFNYRTGEVTFVSEGTSDVRLSSSDTVAKGRGLDLTTYPDLVTIMDDNGMDLTVDIVGTSRGGGEGEQAWDIGAYQVTTSAPTEDINIVDPSMGAGYDYASLSAWEAAEQGNIASANIIAVAECRGGADVVPSGHLNIDGWTTSKNCYILLRNHSSEPPTGVWNSSNYYVHIDTYDRRMNIQVENIRLVGLQLMNDTNAQSANGQYLFFSQAITAGESEMNFHLINNIFRSDETATASKVIFIDSDTYGPKTIVMIGNMIRSNEDAMQITHDPSNYYDTMTWYALNNTIVGDDLGFYLNGTNYADVTQYIRNNISYVGLGASPFYPVETTGNYWTDNDAYNDYNIDNDSDTSHVARGSHGGYGVPTFVDMAGSDEEAWDVRLDSTDTVAKGAGENLHDNSNIPQYLKDYLAFDITGVERPRSGHAVAWDVGAHQLVKMPSGYHLMV